MNKRNSDRLQYWGHKQSYMTERITLSMGPSMAAVLGQTSEEDTGAHLED